MPTYRLVKEKPSDWWMWAAAGFDFVVLDSKMARDETPHRAFRQIRVMLEARPRAMSRRIAIVLEKKYGL
jgi:hypothetical protein